MAYRIKIEGINRDRNIFVFDNVAYDWSTKEKDSDQEAHWIFDFAIYQLWQEEKVLGRMKSIYSEEGELNEEYRDSAKLLPKKKGAYADMLNPDSHMYNVYKDFVKRKNISALEA